MRNNPLRLIDPTGRFDIDTLPPSAADYDYLDNSVLGNDPEKLYYDLLVAGLAAGTGVSLALGLEFALSATVVEAVGAGSGALSLVEGAGAVSVAQGAGSLSLSGGSSLVLAGQQALTLTGTTKALALGGGATALGFYVGGEGTGILSGLCVSCTLESILRPANPPPLNPDNLTRHYIPSEGLSDSAAAMSQARGWLADGLKPHDLALQPVSNLIADGNYVAIMGGNSRELHMIYGQRAGGFFTWHDRFLTVVSADCVHGFGRVNLQNNLVVRASGLAA